MNVRSFAIAVSLCLSQMRKTNSVWSGWIWPLFVSPRSVQLLTLCPVVWVWSACRYRHQQCDCHRHVLFCFLPFSRGESVCSGVFCFRRFGVYSVQFLYCFLNMYSYSHTSAIEETRSKNLICSWGKMQRGLHRCEQGSALKRRVLALP